MVHPMPCATAKKDGSSRYASSIRARSMRCAEFALRGLADRVRDQKMKPFSVRFWIAGRDHHRDQFGAGFRRIRRGKRGRIRAAAKLTAPLTMRDGYVMYAKAV